MRQKKRMEIRLQGNINQISGLEDTKNYCWRKNLVSPYESLWSILHKFASLNAANASSVRSIFGKDSDHIDTANHWKWNERDDLRYFGGLDPLKVAQITNLEDQVIKESVIQTFIKQNERQSHSCTVLRFCKSCLQAGFHSSLFQLLFLKNCPFHKEEFLTRCPNCGEEISYRLNNNALKKPYGCAKCSKVFYQALLKIGYRIPVVKERDQILELIGNWLINRVKRETLGRTLNINNSGSSVFFLERKNKTISNLIRYWIDAFNPSDRVNQALKHQISDSRNSYVKIPFRVINENKSRTDLFGKEWDQDLYGIYKSIGRHLKKTCLAEHVKCIENFGRNLWWDKYALSRDGKICEFANAFLLWRMYFEGLDHPSLLFKKFKGYGFGRLHIEWQPPNLGFSESILKRIFAIECSWAFFECILIANRFHRRDSYSFNWVYLNKSFTPYWIVEPILKEKRVSYYNFHYWIDYSELKERESFKSFENYNKLIDIP